MVAPFPYRYVGGGWFRDSTVPKGEPAACLHGDHAVEAARRALVAEMLADWDASFDGDEGFTTIRSWLGSFEEAK